MEKPLRGPRLARIAQDLEALPFELIDPILKELPFMRTLDLFILPYPRLREAIRYHARWVHLLGEETDEIEYLWTSLDQLASIQYRRSWVQAMGNTYKFVPFRGVLEHVADPTEETTKDQINSSLWGELHDSLFNFLGLLNHKGNWIAIPELQAVFRYLPVDGVIARWAGSVTGPKEDEPSDAFAEDLVLRIRGIDRSVNISQVILELKNAYFRLFQEQSAELRVLADLYERFPRFLKVAGAPELPIREAHVLTRLLIDVNRRQKIPRWNRKEVHFEFRDQSPKLRRTPYRFRYPHPTLVPFEWCLRLFKIVVERREALGIEEKIPLRLKGHFESAIDGLDFIYRHSPGKRLKRTDGHAAENATLVEYPFSNGVLPRPKAELSWLQSFVTMTEWMAKEFPDITRLVAAAQLPILRRRLLVDPSDYRLFIEHESPRTIARQLRADLELCRTGSSSKLPSLLALHMPLWPSPRAIAVAKLLTPRRGCSNDLLQLIYESKITEILRLLKGAPDRKEPEDGRFIVADEITQSSTQNPRKILRDSSEDIQDVQAQQTIPERDLVTTANTLQQLLKEPTLSANAAGRELLSHIIARIENSTEKQNAPNNDSWQASVRKYVASQSRYSALRDCYICGRHIAKPHPTISSMCPPCGNFNLAGSQLSLPPKLSLVGKVAAVTGARVNLGYHVTLRLLRCGARVIASTRYPHDALVRYRAEKDSEEWIERLSIIGADFRSARDAFELAREIRGVVEGWGGTLHILINNAAQTLTDSIEKETSSVKKEELLKDTMKSSHLLPSTSYIAKVRAGNMATIEGLTTRQLATNTSAVGEPVQTSSWVQSLGEIPYEDVISAHSVNAFVPLILVRELLPIMSDGKSAPSSGHARGFIVNVSSREGMFEHTDPGAQSAKNGRHVHTNMSKAALNMITETEAAGAWRTARVAMNTVDPGYMSAAPELDAVHGGEMPIGWEDGAGRVLWPIAVGELEKIGEEGCHAVWGRFLKHYGASRANLQQGLR
ncbi:NAD(P)-binding protein [Xylaria scruposa]|nr:NAD(P)-binding protein [Xylaria scruposa]